MQIVTRKALAAAAIGTLIVLPMHARASTTPKAQPPELQAPGARITRLPGMDVSSYQGNIDWGQVGAGQIRFSITRASHGSDADTKYATYRTGAANEGIAFGAYHYAVPKGTATAAVKQADFFLANATPTSGDILPVMDIEETSGKSPARLQDWVAAFLNRVRHKTGVTPMIYTSPSFWTSAMGDTARFARRGYPLWIANWGVSRPTVPANDWAGNGWTFWQWTDCRAVNGINGCVDGDRFNGKNLHRVEIP